MSIEEKLYPPKCARCGRFISYDDFVDGQAKTHVDVDKNNFAKDIWFEHNYNCKEILRKFNEQNTSREQE